MAEYYAELTLRLSFQADDVTAAYRHALGSTLAMYEKDLGSWRPTGMNVFKSGGWADKESREMDAEDA